MVGFVFRLHHTDQTDACCLALDVAAGGSFPRIPPWGCVAARNTYPLCSNQSRSLLRLLPYLVTSPLPGGQGVCSLPTGRGNSPTECGR
jgi:hypothetical protein